jgi:hypothetical protein
MISCVPWGGNIGFCHEAPAVKPKTVRLSVTAYKNTPHQNFYPWSWLIKKIAFR